MYAQVQLNQARTSSPVLVPGDALQVGADGTKVAVMRPDRTVHFQRIEVGRDYGDRLEVLSGLSEGDIIIPTPGDAVTEGVKVAPVSGVQEPPDKAAKKK
jgi:multidrug efflux pump subunit AcrA (membrane-fusion protein)